MYTFRWRGEHTTRPYHDGRHRSNAILNTAEIRGES